MTDSKEIKLTVDRIDGNHVTLIVEPWFVPALHRLAEGDTLTLVSATPNECPHYWDQNDLKCRLPEGHDGRHLYGLPYSLPCPVYGCGLPRDHEGSHIETMSPPQDKKNP